MAAVTTVDGKPVSRPINPADVVAPMGDDVVELMKPMLKQRPEVVSVFAAQHAKSFARYECELSFDEYLMGGIPKNPRVIEQWLRTKLRSDIPDDVEYAQVMVRTLRQMGHDVDEVDDPEVVQAALSAAVDTIAANGFADDQDGRGPYIRANYVKAAIKESASVVFVGEKWGKYTNSRDKEVGGKQPRSFLAERVFVEPIRLHLGQPVAPIPHLQITHTTNWRTGQPNSGLTNVDYVVQPVIGCEVLVSLDRKGREVVSLEDWAAIWAHAEKNGIGAARSQGFGTFLVTRWNRIN